MGTSKSVLMAMEDAEEFRDELTAEKNAGMEFDDVRPIHLKRKVMQEQESVDQELEVLAGRRPGI